MSINEFIGKNSFENIKFLIRDNKFKKILIFAGKTSFFKSGACEQVKTILNEVFAYINLSQLDSNEFSEKSRIIMLYALCGFGNFSSVGILLGGLGAIIPDRKEELISIGGRALYASLLASCMTGFMVGIIY